LAFDHDYILRKAMEKLREDIHFEPIGFDLLDSEFTMSELQRLYEAILGIQFDRRNFHKKMLQTGIIEEADEDETVFFGKNREMRSMSIDELFGGSAAESPTSCPTPRPTSNDDKRSTRRWGTKFRFNKRRYDKFKEDNNFRLEF
jgi:hypothetical protein